MANLVIDIGNSYIKTAIFSFDAITWIQSHTSIDEQRISEILADHKPEKAIVSSVKKHAESWEAAISKQIPLIKFNNSMGKMVKNHYRTPHTLGADRLAAVIGAYTTYPGKANLVIDAGTCITYDGIDAGANYYGGSISPGLTMRYKALNHYTDGLPVIDADTAFIDDTGYDTATAIRSGVQSGMKFEILGFIQSYFAKHPDTNVILTGGDSIFFDTLLKNSIFAPHIKIEPHLVLKGLNAVIQHHND
ncbi:type III pantothenate kinase [Mucilaginibacter sp. HMF5004]|uniref:type III pantothenate kinase n=1 Tax=Mucilaginibacter rivuli TaxID=2857527 RepID=UPI001C5D8C9E|nr:type III pantothenate kinase [Mucilaginibacter rivuli]MBW4888600.1 type III pantothenate kinase [Mucilaginibacter rivuli]